MYGVIPRDVWCFTGFDGHYQTQKKRETWNLLRSLADQFSIPWLCVDDYNEIRSDNEKCGGALHPEKQMVEFNVVISKCQFSNLPLLDPNKRGFVRMVQSIL